MFWSDAGGDCVSISSFWFILSSMSFIDLVTIFSMDSFIFSVTPSHILEVVVAANRDCSRLEETWFLGLGYALCAHHGQFQPDAVSTFTTSPDCIPGKLEHVVCHIC